MTRFVLRGVLTLAVVCSFMGTALAQSTGRITGTVFDSNGIPLKGVKVVAKSPSDIAPKTVFTDGDGFFRVIGLMPGVFTVTASAKGLKTYVQKNIKLTLSQPYDLSIIMEVESEVEDFTIVAEAPTVNTTNATQTSKFDEQFLDALPLSDRTSVQGVMSEQVAGAVGDGNSPQFRGGTSTQNVFQLDGFQVNSTGGGAGQTLTFQTVASIEMKTGGYGAEDANASGAVLNAVTKSGSNKFEVDFNGFHENTRLQLFRDNLDSDEFGGHTFLNLNVAGPIIKDKLWFFVTVEGRNQITTRQADRLNLRPTPPRRSDNSVRSTGKLTWQLTPRNKLQGLWTISRLAIKNQSGNINVDRDAQQRLDTLDWFAGLIWESLLTDSLIFRSQLGVQSFTNESAPQLCDSDPELCDHLPQIRQINPVRFLQNRDFHGFQTSETLEFKNKLEYFLDSKTFGNHSITLTGRFYGAQRENKESTPGDSIFIFDGQTPLTRRQAFANDPLVEEGRFGWAITNASSWLVQGSLQDQFKLPNYRHLTITPGIGFFKSVSRDAFDRTVADFTTFTPHIAAAWDITKDGRTVIRGSFNQYVDAGNLDIATFVSQARAIRVCDWNPVTQTFSGGCRIEGGTSGRTIGRSCGPDGVDANGNSCEESLKVPRTWEYTFGFEREVVQGIAIGADVQFRRYTNPYEDRETNRLWNPAGTALDPTGGFRNGRPVAVFNLETAEEAERKYTGVLASIKKREGKLKMNFTYQWARLEGNVVDGARNDFLNNPAQDVFQYGFLPGDSRHSIRAQAVYQWAPWISTGATYSYTSGTPVQLRYFNNVTAAYTDFRARRGFDPGVDINDIGDDSEYRLPDQQLFNLQVRFNLKPLTKINAELWADFLNLLALRTTTAVETQADSPGVRVGTARLEPLRMRLNFRVKF